MTKQNNRYKLKLIFQEIIDSEVGIIDYPILKISKICLSESSIDSTFELFKKELKEFIANKKIEDKMKKEDLINI